MRLIILDRGHSFGTKALFALIRLFSRRPVLEVIKVVKYRPDFCGGQEIHARGDARAFRPGRRIEVRGGFDPTEPAEVVVL